MLYAQEERLRDFIIYEMLTKEENTIASLPGPSSLHIPFLFQRLCQGYCLFYCIYIKYYAFHLLIFGSYPSFT